MPIIEVNHVTKEYRLGQMKSLKQSMLGAFDRLSGRLTPKQEGMRQALHTRVKSGLDPFSFWERYAIENHARCIERVYDQVSLKLV